MGYHKKSKSWTALSFPSILSPSSSTTTHHSTNTFNNNNNNNNNYSNSSDNNKGNLHHLPFKYSSTLSSSVSNDYEDDDDDNDSTSATITQQHQGKARYLKQNEKKMDLNKGDTISLDRNHNNNNHKNSSNMNEHSLLNHSNNNKKEDDDNDDDDDDEDDDVKYPVPSFYLVSNEALTNEYSPETTIIPFITPTSFSVKRASLLAGMLDSLVNVIEDIPFCDSSNDPLSMNGSYCSSIDYSSSISSTSSSSTSPSIHSYSDDEEEEEVEQIEQIIEGNDSSILLDDNNHDTPTNINFNSNAWQSFINNSNNNSLHNSIDDEDEIDNHYNGLLTTTLTTTTSSSSHFFNNDTISNHSIHSTTPLLPTSSSAATTKKKLHRIPSSSSSSLSTHEKKKLYPFTIICLESFKVVHWSPLFNESSSSLYHDLSLVILVSSHYPDQDINDIMLKIKKSLRLLSYQKELTTDKIGQHLLQFINLYFNT